MVFFISVTNQISMRANVTDNSPVLEDDDEYCEESTDGTCKTSNVTQEVEKRVDIAPDDFLIPIKLVCNGKLHIVVIIVGSQMTPFNFENLELKTLL